MIRNKISTATFREPIDSVPGGLSLSRNVSWTLTANIIYAAFQWGILVVLTKLVPPEVVGQFGIAYAIGAPVIMFANLFLRHLQATDAQDQFHFGHYLALRLFTSLLALVVIAIIALITTFSWPTKLVIMAVGLAKVVESLQDIVYGLLQKQERMDRMAISIISKAPLELMAMSLGVWLTQGLMGGILGLILVRSLLLLSYDRQSASLVLNNSTSAILPPSYRPRLGWGAFQPLWSWRILANLAWLSLPMAVASTLSSLNANIPPYFVSHYLTEQNLGIFVALSYVLVGGKMVVMALGLSLSPRLSKYYAQADLKAFRRLILKSSLMVALLGMTGVVLVHLIGQEFLSLIYQPEYAMQVKVLLWLMLAATFGYLAIFLSQVITAARYLKVQLPIYLINSLALMAACYHFVPLAGIMGAAYAVLCSALVMFLLNGGVVFYILCKSESHIISCSLYKTTK